MARAGVSFRKLAAVVRGLESSRSGIVKVATFAAAAVVVVAIVPIGSVYMCWVVDVARRDFLLASFGYLGQIQICGTSVTSIMIRRSHDNDDDDDDDNNTIRNSCCWFR